MKYYKDECLNTYTAKFTNPKMEENFIIKLYRKFQVAYWMVASQSFLIDSLTMTFNFLYTTFNYEDKLFMGIQVAFVCGFIITYKYLNDINDRKLYLALQNFEQWEKINERIMPNLFVIQKFDFRTHRMLVHDCNKKAKEFNIHKSSDEYTQFLNQLQLNYESSSQKNISGTATTVNNRQKTHQNETLKDLLLEKHAEIYQNFLTKKEEQSKKNGRTYEEETYSEVFDQTNVSFVHPISKKTIYLRVKIIALEINEPLLIICMEDVSQIEKIKMLKKQRNLQNDMIQELISCIKAKISSIQLKSMPSAQYIQRHLFFIRFMIDSFMQYMRPLKIEEFQLSEVVSSVSHIFQEQQQHSQQEGEHGTHLNFDYGDHPEEISLKQDKGNMFQVIAGIISSIQERNLTGIVCKVKKDMKNCERLSMVFCVSNNYSHGFNKETMEFKGLFDIPGSSQLNELCNTHLKQIMGQICMTNEVKILFERESDFGIEIEFLVNLHDLKVDPVVVLEKPKNRFTATHHLSQVCVPIKKSTIGTASKKQSEHSTLNVRFDFVEKDVGDSQVNGFLELQSSTCYQNRERFLSTQVLCQTGILLSQQE